MKSVAINSNVYRGAEQYANLHNISVADAVEKAILLFLQKVQPKQKLMETTEFKELSGKGGRPVPADENGLDALVEQKYKL